MWQFPPLILSLETGEVHLWRSNLERVIEEVEQLSAILSDEEIARANRFYFPQHRRRFTVARATLRRILGYYLGIEPQTLQFTYKSRGKPELAANKNKWLQFNLSHSEGWALYGVTRDRRIGVDLERRRSVKDLEQLAERFYSPAEYGIISQLPAKEKEIAFFRGWTVKEAYLKATGEGLSGGLDQVEVSLAVDESSRLLKLPGNASVSDWSVACPDVHPEYLAAIAVESGRMQLRFFDF